MPNGLLVNDIEREQTVLKYLLKEAKKGQNSKTKNIKDQLCLNFILNNYKSTVFKNVTEFSLKNDDSSISIDKYLREFIQNCEIIIEKTCSTLTSVKRVFELSSQLNPTVSAMMKSLLKSFDEDEDAPGSSRKIENLSKIVKTKNQNQPPNISNSRNLRFEKKQKERSKSPTVVLEQLDLSALPIKIGNKSSNVHIVEKNDELIHPLELFSDRKSSGEEDNTRKLRSRKVIKTNEKVCII